MQERLATITHLERGAHQADSIFCLMEAVAFVNGDPWSDSPECACPVLSAYGRALNDAMSDEQRQRLIPYIPLLIGTKSSFEVEQQRAFILADLAVRVIAPIALRQAKLNSRANGMAAPAALSSTGCCATPAIARTNSDTPNLCGCISLETPHCPGLTSFSILRRPRACLWRRPRPFPGPR